MSRMIHSADISYSSINAPTLKDNQVNSCFRVCFLNFPYATITSTFLVISGLLISLISVFHLSGVLDRLSQDLFYKRLLWLNEFKVILFFVVGLISILIIINLIIGFSTSLLRLDGRSQRNTCYCSRQSTTECLIRLVFLANQFVFFLVLILIITFCIFAFVLYILSILCNNEKFLEGHEQSFDFSNNQNTIDFQPFSSLLHFHPDETHLLLFKDNRLKILCRDYVSTLRLYDLISLLGLALLFLGFYCYSINLTVNRIRIASFKKYTELLYLNGTEMTPFTETLYDHNAERF